VVTAFAFQDPMDDALEREIETRIEALGFEIVELEQSGSRTRPILRIRIDHREAAVPEPGAALPARAVTVEDCTRVSRAIEALLDEIPDVGERYVLEVSSPGLERPLVKPRDYERFAGREVAIKTSHALDELGKRVQGVLQGISARDVVTVDVDGKPVAIELGNIKKAHLVFNWDDARKKK